MTALALADPRCRLIIFFGHLSHNRKASKGLACKVKKIWVGLLCRPDLCKRWALFVMIFKRPAKISRIAISHLDCGLPIDWHRRSNAVKIHASTPRKRATRDASSSSRSTCSMNASKMSASRRSTASLKTGDQLRFVAMWAGIV